MPDSTVQSGYPAGQEASPLPQGSRPILLHGQYTEQQTPHSTQLKPRNPQGKAIVWIAVAIVLALIIGFFLWHSSTRGASPVPTPVGESIGRQVVSRCSMEIKNTPGFSLVGIRALNITKLGPYGSAGTQYMMTGIVSGSIGTEAVQTYDVTCTAVLSKEVQSISFSFDTTNVKIDPTPLPTPTISDSSSPTPTPVVRITHA